MFQFETEENGQNEIVSYMDKSEVISNKKYCDISYTEGDFETEIYSPEVGLRGRQNF